MNWYLKVFKQYADFKGRARRKEYWMFLLFHILVLVALVFIDSLLGTTIGEGINEIGLLYMVYSLLAIIPGLAVGVRRLHDIGKSGWWTLINLIPLIGAIWFIVLVCMEGESRPNAWGENPKGIGNDNVINQIGRE